MPQSLVSIAFDVAREVHWGSDIESLHLVGPNLVVKVAREMEDESIVRGLEIVFDDVSALRYLDEVDLARYWTSDQFVSGSHVLEVLGGGWGAEENVLQGYETRRREWLVVTGNGCVSVFSPSEPKINEALWPRDA